MKKILFTFFIAAISVIAFAQWSNDPAENNRITPLATEIYDHDLKVLGNGTSIVVFNRPIDENTATFLQIIDINGNMKFGEEGKLISNYPTLSWTMAGEILFVDADGNALIVVTDCRNSTADDISYTLYKVSQTGEMLWGENGVDLCNGMAYGFVADIKIVQLEDGSYVCAWMVETNITYIQMMRLSQAGEMLWNESEARIYETSTPNEYPYLVNAGDNKVILVFARGTTFNKNIKARKIDSNGAPVWANDVIAYNGGFGYTPVWVVVRVIPDQMGGAFVGWFDDRNNTWIESTYISHIKTDGTHGFPSGDAGEKIGYSSLRSFYPEMYFDKNEGFLYVTWRETNDNQWWQQMKAQKLNVSTAELMWGNNGKDIYPLTYLHSAAFYSIQGEENGNIAIFFTNNTYHDEYFWGWDINNVTLLNSYGEFVWDEEIIQFSTPVSFKGRLVSTPLVFNNYWLTAWNDERIVSGDPGGSKKIYMQRINKDGTLGDNDASICETPVNLEATNDEIVNVRLSWEEGNEENMNWDIRYKSASDNSWIYIEALEEKTYFLEALEQYTIYFWTVRAHCEEEQISDWAEEKSFYTGGWGINDSNKEMLTVYASSKMLNIINLQNRYIEKVQLFDVAGRLLGEYAIHHGNNVLIPTHFSSETIVFVKIIGKNEVENHKIIIR